MIVLIPKKSSSSNSIRISQVHFSDCSSLLHYMCVPVSSSVLKVDMESLMCATILVHVVHTKFTTDTDKSAQIMTPKN